MTDKQTPPDWVLIEAAKRVGWGCGVLLGANTYSNSDTKGRIFRALCDMIERYEQPPVDRKLLCAREAMAESCTLPESEGAYRRGAWDYAGAVKQCLRAIELWEEGFGK
jgi:hypothetical protein